MTALTPEQEFTARGEAKAVLERGVAHNGTLRLLMHVAATHPDSILGVEPYVMKVNRFVCRVHGITEVASPPGEDVSTYPCPICWVAGCRVVGPLPERSRGQEDQRGWG